MAKINLPTCAPQYAQANCTSCRLQCSSKIPLSGGGKRKVLVLFDKQDSIQQATKTYMRGERYKYVHDVLLQYGLTSDDYWITSVIQCFSDSPELKHATHCKPNIIKMIQTLKPELVICFGQFAATVMLQDSIVDGKGTDLDRVHGFLHPDRKLSCNILCTYNPHPSNYKKDTPEDKIIRRDIHIAVNALKTPFKAMKDESQCVRVLTPKDAVNELKMRIADTTPRYSALDYETNCLKPYNGSAKLYSCAISESVDDSFAFMLDDTTIPYMKEYWRTQHITKIAHNTAFERTWTMVKLGVVPYKLVHDTMLMAHTLDNRDRTWLSIKFLAPMLTGCTLWNKHTEPYFETNKEKYGEYGINRIQEIPQRELLKYNGYDALLELRVFHILMSYLKTYYNTFPSEDSICVL